MEAILEKPSKNDQKIAKAVRVKVSQASVKVANSKGSTITLKIDGIDNAMDIPKSALHLFFAIMENMADGNSIAIFLSGSNAEISTQQAADILGVSRPHIVNLLEKGEIPYRKVGAHRRIHMNDLITYEKRMKKNRADKLDLLAQQAQELNMGY